MSKKILFVISSLGSGGAERQIVTLATILNTEGFNVEFLIYHRDFFYRHILDESSIKINIIQSKSNFDRILKARKFIRYSNSDIVISFLEVPSFLSCIAAIGGKNWKLITTERSSKESTFISLRGKIFGFFRRNSNNIVCNSYNARKMWEAFYPEYSSKLSVIYNPVVLPSISLNYVPKINNKLNVVVAASYQYLKNPIGLITALSLMDSEDREKINVQWYGRIEITANDTYAYDESIELIRKNKLESVIQLNKATKDIANIMQQADVVALFSKLEGLPNAICEGMMIGKPIIMTKVSDYENLVDKTNGFLCDWDNPETIKQALKDAINLSEESLLELGRNSHTKAKQLFSSKKIVEQWLQLIN